MLVSLTRCCKFSIRPDIVASFKHNQRTVSIQRPKFVAHRSVDRTLLHRKWSAIDRRPIRTIIVTKLIRPIRNPINNNSNHFNINNQYNINNNHSSHYQTLHNCHSYHYNKFSNKFRLHFQSFANHYKQSFPVCKHINRRRPIHNDTMNDHIYSDKHIIYRVCLSLEIFAYKKHFHRCRWDGLLLAKTQQKWIFFFSIRCQKMLLSSRNCTIVSIFNLFWCDSYTHNVR